MAALTATTMQGSGQRTAAQNTLTASDTFDYVMGRGALLVLYNPTGSPINPMLKGDNIVSRTAPGGASETLTTGLSSGLNVLAEETRVLNLDEMFHWLSPTNTITSGTGLIAILLTP